MTAGWGVRTVRAAMFAAVCVVLAALGHVLMSGRHVPGWALAAGLAATALAGWTLADRERGLPLVVTLVVATQAALHSAFSLAQPTTGQSPAMDMGSADMGSMHMGAMDSMDMGHMSATTTDPSSTGMLAAHLLAALLCGLWLAHGERAAFRVLRAVATRLAAPLRLLLALPAPPHRPRLRPRRPRSERAPRLLLLGHAITSRGPPLGTAVS
ncbi:hypothetical protein OG601_28080 [Streptomyces sp. NBC_01239]|uniref:hypothetical protein n=1 Tax=Streptomyces sp. NBC_01239 TaxID=2903792 RepID=UPI00225A9925|nr:hypothetical protein [Streptomyces sp. NBC_01239]MCX4814459.1 hypothetical protein [Streptomyces sp. NBC_01239]